MDYSDIQAGLNDFVERYDSQTYIGSYRETSRSSLLNDGLSTRANSLWKMAEYVVARYDKADNSIDAYIKGWKQLAASSHNQYLLLEEEKNSWGMYDSQGNRLGGEEFIQDYFSKQKRASTGGKEITNRFLFPYPLQQIFYGAPGTGKSHEIKEQTKGNSVVRTTFHPDSDYSTFVGAYKPIMEDQDARVVPVVVNNGISLNQNSGTYKEKRISYQFVKQAFLKAYLSAWKKFSLGVSLGKTNQNSKVNVSIENDTWILEKVFDDRVAYTKESVFTLGSFEAAVKKCWENIIQSDDPDNYMAGTFEKYEATACLWYKEKYSSEHTAIECWDAVKKELKEGNVISYVPGKNQSYTIFLRDNNVVITSKASATKKGVRDRFESTNKNGSSVRDAIAQKLRNYVMDIDIFETNNFDALWNKLKEEVNQSLTPASLSTNLNGVQPQFLIIEEINRGNCAQIFGDLFQLLDRSNNGFSTYPIDADTDIKNAIEKAFREEKDYQLNYDLNIEGAVEGYTSNYGSSLSSDVQSGRVLLLPPNLFIWATMNTSDQSLFPIDSAFKRRWEWKYIKIKKGKDENGNELNWMIDVKLKDANGQENNVSWWNFIDQINKIIASMTSSADKQLGYFFCKAKDEMIDKQTFVSKVIFYLWNDVFKDYGFEDNSLFRYIDNKGEEQDLTFPDFFKDEVDEVNDVRLTDFVQKVMSWKKKSDNKD